MEIKRVNLNEKYQLKQGGDIIFVQITHYDGKDWIEISPHFQNKGFYFKNHLSLDKLKEWKKLLDFTKDAIYFAEEHLVKERLQLAIINHTYGRPDNGGNQKHKSGDNTDKTKSDSTNKSDAGTFKNNTKNSKKRS